MSQQIQFLLEEIQKTSFLEWLAFIFSIIYIFLATKEIIWCWIFAILSSFLYIFLFFRVNLYIDSGLQFFYLIMAFVGWINWGNRSKHKITFWKVKYHIIMILLNIIFALTLGFIFDKFTDQAYPYIDAFIFCFSISATFLITKKIIENWLYFIVIDLIATFIYWQRGLHLTSILFIIYTLLAIFGFFSWQFQLKSKNENSIRRT